MACHLLLSALVFSGISSAGEVLLTTEDSVTIDRGGVTIARATGPGQLSLGDFPPGPSTLRFSREGSEAVEATIEVPKTGTLSLRLEDDTIVTEATTEPLVTGPEPIVIFRPLADQEFSVIIDNTKRFKVSEEKMIEGLKTGVHTVEIRSADDLTIWARGRLTLETGATIVLDIESGRPVRALGNEETWKAGVDAARLEP